MAETIATVPADKPENSVLSENHPFLELVEEINEIIAQRAYELFEADGSVHGRDRENWLAAESEILLKTPVQVAETEKEITITADVPGFKDTDLEVRIAPRTACITGQRQSESEKKEGNVLYNERVSKRVFRTIDLNSEVDTEKTKATVADGVLEIKLSKVAAAKDAALTKTAGA